MPAFLVSIALLLFSCDLHEFPDLEKARQEVMLVLDFDKSLPDYKTVDLETKSFSKSWTKVSDNPNDYYLRHIVQIYRADANGQFNRNVYRRIEFSHSSVNVLSDTLKLALPLGLYKFIVWTDHVLDINSDQFYNTQQFEEITLQGEHVGCNDMRDAFRGTTEMEVRYNDGAFKVPLKMERPFAKYTFISTDLDDFYTKVLAYLAAKESEQQKGEETDTRDSDTKSVNLDEFKVVFNYTGFMPNSYNLYTMKPADASTGVSYEAKMSALLDGTAELGFDYVFVNGNESSVSVSVSTYDKEGNLMARSDPFEVPLVRSKHTIIKGRFLTTVASGGVGIDPSYNGDFNIPLN